MKTLSPSDLIALGGLVLAALTAMSGAVLWYANAEKKRYGIERDFDHVKNSLKQMSSSISYEFKDLNDRFDDVDKELLRIEAYLIRKPVNPDPD